MNFSPPTMPIPAIPMPSTPFLDAKWHDTVLRMILRDKEREMNEAMADLPEPKPTQLQLNRWAAEQDEITTEGRRHGK